MTSARLWTIWGAFFGLGFPTIALSIRIAERGGAATYQLLLEDPLLWIILTAPFFLGAFAWVGGRQNDKVRKFSAHLELIVQERTKELEQRNHEMRLVLDNVNLGLATISKDGTLSNERSAKFAQWFPTVDESSSFHATLAANDNDTEAMLSLGWEGLTDGFLPLDVALSQIPTRLNREGRHYELDFRLITRHSEFEGALLIASDVTEEIERRTQEAKDRQLLAVFESVMQDRNGFIGFFNETDKLVRALCCDGLNEKTIKRYLHTVKGNCAIYQINTVADLCHTMEGACAEETRSPNETELQTLRQTWKDFASTLRHFVGETHEKIVEVRLSELESIAQTVIDRRPQSEVLGRLFDLRLEPARSRLIRISHQIQRVASMAGKPAPQIEINDDGVRLPVDDWEDFWASLVHVVRNAIDHGIEMPEERLERGKPKEGKLILDASATHKEITIGIRDDGRGIDWKRLAEKGRRAGLKTDRQSDLRELLFSDGISTTSQVTEISGRGVGMSAVRCACEQLGGTIVVQSEPQRGASFRFVIPRREDELSLTSWRSAARPSVLCGE